MIAEVQIVLMGFLVVLAIASLSVRDLLAGVFLLGAYSYLLCLTWTGVGAVDVALTEASVGAGISTALFIATIHRTRRYAKKREPGDSSQRRWQQLFAALVTAVVGVILLAGTSEWPPFGQVDSPASAHLSGVYIASTFKDSHVPNIVTAVLADYRGYDTMFETVVVFAAGLAVAALLRRPHKSRESVSGAPSVSERAGPR